MITKEALSLLRQLSKGPKTRKQQDAYSTMLGIRQCEDVFLDYGFITLGHDGKATLMTITDKGRKMLEICEEIMKLGVDFD